jgi:hypothetical protein
MAGLADMTHLRSMRWPVRSLLPLWYVALAVAGALALPASLPVGSVPLYQVLAHAPAHPALFLDHWAGPLFVAFTAPWAAIGPRGMQWAAVLCFLGTAWCAGRVLRRTELPGAWLFPVLLLAAPAYRDALAAGTNEPLFGLVTMASVAALHARRTVLAAALASLLPLVRPEWAAVLPCIALWLAGMRRWRALPWLALGTVLYMPWGGAPWQWRPAPWARIDHRTPLMGHFGQAGTELGTTAVVLLTIAVLAAAALWWVRTGERPALRRALFAVAAPGCMIVLLHALLGWGGRQVVSAGTHAWAVAWPLGALFIAQVLIGALREGTRRPAVPWAGAVLSALAVIVPAGHFVRDAQAGPERPGLHQWLFERISTGGVVGLNDPVPAHRFGLDPWAAWAALRAGEAWRLRPEERLLWTDARTGPEHLRVPVEDLLRDERLRLTGLEHFAPDVYDSLPPLALWTFTRGPETRRRDTVTVFRGGAHPDIPHRLDLDPAVRQHGGRPCFQGTEFPMEFAELPINDPRYHATEVIVRGTAAAGDARLELVIAEEGPDGHVGYWPRALWSGPFAWRMHLPARGPGVRTKLYVWDRAGAPFCITGLEVLLVRTYRGE